MKLMTSFKEASVTMLASILTLMCSLTLNPSTGSGVLAVVLCLSLSRSQLDRDQRGRIEAAFALPVVSMIAVGVGFLLLHTPWLGAFVFVAGMFLSIWLRRFGDMAQRAGSLIALPFVALLTTPHISHHQNSAVPAVLIPVVIALLALLWVSLLHTAAFHLRFLKPVPKVQTKSTASTKAKTESALKPIASTRMAIQMAVALGISFGIGYVYFPERWSWVVLTAFIVSAGNRGRLDVAYKSVLRVIGAAAGTLSAIAISTQIESHALNHQIVVALILGALFLGIWLRPMGYGWWALFVTLTLALLQELAGTSALRILWPRLEEICIGAVIAVATAWFVLPVRSTAVLRKRLSQALASLSDALDPAIPERKPDEFIAAVDAVEEIVPAFRASRLVMRYTHDQHPADWVDALLACKNPAVTLIECNATPGSARRAVGAARKSLREPKDILLSLQELRSSLIDSEKTIHVNEHG
ncbi:FUSC family protein [Solimicrobium silvestre]|uniref:Fusaric acid resistance protein-like n=1 Tax=Solimicrobium silvestre TaxID=2099400 RepID=A0A2S9GXQ9_9BURK|nr:FUSC family protein [Solimicrobium silvestre]PRC92499.1 Fusaric acid resistance protein-like [Solimicrobium silvestre]